MQFALCFVQTLGEFEVLLFHLGQATNQAMALTLEGLMLLVQRGQAPVPFSEILARGNQEIDAGIRCASGGSRH
jgi:hypothetical protein